jgi:hypothetical protein
MSPLSVLLTWKVLFFEQDCQTGQDYRARNRFVLRNRPSLPVWLRPSGRAVPLGTQLACPGIDKRHLGIPGSGAWELSLFSSAGPGWGQLLLHGFMAGERGWDRWFSP